MSVLVDRTNVDQPFTQAATVPSGTDAGKDRVYVGLNDFARDRRQDRHGRDRASMRRVARRRSRASGSRSAAPARPDRTARRSDRRSTPTAPCTPSSTAGGLLRRHASSPPTSWSSATTTGASGATPFTALKDPSDNVAGGSVAHRRAVHLERHARAGPPRRRPRRSPSIRATARTSTSRTATCSRAATRSTSGARPIAALTWSADLKTISNAKNPALAIATNGKVGLAYQRVDRQRHRPSAGTPTSSSRTDAFATSKIMSSPPCRPTRRRRPSCPTSATTCT